MNQDQIADLIQGIIEAQHKQLVGPLHVLYSKKTPFLYAAREFKSGVILEVGVELDHPKFMKIIKRAGCAAVEVYRGTTKAIEVRLNKNGEVD